MSQSNSPAESVIEGIERGRLLELGFEQAHAEAQKLAHVERVDTGGTEVYSGTHPVYGNIHIVIPAFGESILLLPFVVRQF